MSESFEDQRSRVELMAAGDPTWDLSDSDIAALKAVLLRLDALADQKVEQVEVGDDDVTSKLLATLDELYPLPDDTKRAERAGRTAFALKRWMEKAVDAEIPQVIARLRAAGAVK